MAKNGEGHDNETRSRVLKAAAHLFAERGFNHVSVRDICKEAGSNVASVNYHFGDKLRLYRELISTVADQMNESKVSAFEAAAGRSPEEHLRAYIRGFMHRLLCPEQEENSWMEALIARETTEPTSAVDLMIEKGIKPAGERLNKLVGEVMGLPPDDWRVVLGATNVQALCLWYRTTRALAQRMIPGLRYTPEVVDGLAESVARFALGGLSAVAPERELKGPAQE